MFKQYHPPHIYLDKKFYFITARTLDKQQFLDSDTKKEIFKKILNKTIKKYDISLYAWVISANHYHILIYIRNQGDLIRFIKSLHGETAILLNKLDNKPGRKIWYQYWDRCIRSEEDFWKHFNYIHNNPIKHGIIKRLDDLPKYKFSSYRFYLDKHGEEWLFSCFERYPIKDFTVDGEI